MSKTDKKNILVIYTGGTIGMIHDEESGTLKPFNFGRLSAVVPELKKLPCRIDFHSFDPLIDSSDMQPSLWTKMARQIEVNYHKYDAFIILHGTDTMAYTASALSYMLQNLNKPVILTGSQLPIGEIRTDARTNLITAVEIASSNVVIPEVCICFDNKLFRGNRTEKYTSLHFDAFQSINYPPLAEAGTEIIYNHEYIREVNNNTLKVVSHFCEEVFVIKLFPGISMAAIKSVVELPGIKGIILETYGSGNAPKDLRLLNILKEAIKKDIVVVNVSQCSGGVVQMEKYENGMVLKQAGVVSGKDMTTEAATTKLMFLLGSEAPATEVKVSVQYSIAGELSSE
ncbi:MAG: L-asparaginase 1 [Bacteroidetes bacterium ADurb.Bin141]|nr:MAG: L-asparaginase 1 [Bacteroidetes bacterium ADurb.Bin141]